MKLGNIKSQKSWLTHPITKDILQLAKEHPDYPIAVLAGENANIDCDEWMYCSSVRVEITEILDCESEWWDEEWVCDSRGKFKEYAYCHIQDKLEEELGRVPTDKEVDEAWKEVEAAHEPYWKKAIVIFADN